MKYIMLTRFASSVCILAVFVQLNAQQALRLNDCIKIAYINRVEVLNAEVDMDSRVEELKMARSSVFPSANAGYSHDLNYGIHSTDVMGDYTGSFFLSGSTQLFKWFDVWKKIKYANVSANQQSLEIEQRKFNVYKQVTESFYNHLVRKEQLAARKRQKALSDSILNTTIALYDAGKIFYSNVEETRLQSIQDTKNLKRAKNDLEQSMIQLKRVMQHTDSINIDYDYYNQFAAFELPGYKSFNDTAYNRYPYLDILDTQLELYKLNYQILKSGNLPYLGLKYSLSSEYSELRMNYNSYPINRDIENQMRGIVSLNVSIPIYNKREHKTSIAISKNTIEQQTNLIEAETLKLKTLLEEQYVEAQSSLDIFELSGEELESIQEIVGNYLNLYSYGKRDVFSLLNYKKQLNEIESRYILNKYETLLRIELINMYINY